jgi:hypothetical protein
VVLRAPPDPLAIPLFPMPRLLPLPTLPLPMPRLLPLPMLPLPVPDPPPVVPPMLPLLLMFEFITIGVGDIIVVPLMFEFIMLVLRLLAFEVVLSPPQPNVPAAIKSDAVKMVFLIVAPVRIKKIIQIVRDSAIFRPPERERRIAPETVMISAFRS